MRRDGITARLERDRKKKQKRKVVAKAILAVVALLLVSIATVASARVVGPPLARACSGFSERFFSVSEVSIKGASEYAEKDIRGYVEPIIKLKPGMFSVPSREIAGWLASRPYLRGAEVRREFPGKIVIAVEEKKMVALVVRHGFEIVDESGAVVRPMCVGENIDLPVITIEPGMRADAADEGIRNAASFVASDTKTVPALTPSEILVTPAGLVLKSSDLKRQDATVVPVYLGSDELPRKMEYLKKIWPDVVAKKDGIEYIDGRFRKGVVVKQKTSTEVAAHGEGKI